MKSLHLKLSALLMLTMVFTTCIFSEKSVGRDLDEVLKAGKLRHLGIVYANFVTKEKTGLDVELMQLFAEHLGVDYEFVETDWQNVVADLTGKVVRPQGEDIEILEEDHPVRGDVIATGFTILPWREKIVNFSETAFPTGIWLLARADSPLQPIRPTGDIHKDVGLVKQSLSGVSVLGLKDSCLDPNLYALNGTGATIKTFPANRDLNEMIPAVMARMTDTTLMDVPVALIALEKWPGEIKVIGPVSPDQGMACAFAKTSPKLSQAFENFFQKLKNSGTYKQLVQKYYPSLFSYYPEFLML